MKLEGQRAKLMEINKKKIRKEAIPLFNLLITEMKMKCFSNNSSI